MVVTCQVLFQLGYLSLPSLGEVNLEWGINVDCILPLFATLNYGQIAHPIHPIWHISHQAHHNCSSLQNEIASINVETSRIDTSGPGDSASKSRMLLIYSSTRYDTVVLAPEPNTPHGFCAGVVPAIGTGGGCVLDTLHA